MTKRKRETGFNPLLDGEDFDSMDFGDHGLSDGDRIVDRVTMSEWEYPDLFEQPPVGGLQKSTPP